MWYGVVLLCVAGVEVDHFNPDVCIWYRSESVIPTEERCLRAVDDLIKTEEMQALLVMPEYDLELSYKGCRELPEKV